MTDTQNGGLERIDEDIDAVSGDTRIRVEGCENETYVLKRERYGLVQLASEKMGDDESFEQYDWYTDETFVLRSTDEAEQFSALLAKEGAFDPNVLFFRQRDWSTDDDEAGADQGDDR